VDQDKSRFTKTKTGANYYIAVGEILEAYGRLDQWVVDTAYLYADHVTGLRGLEPVQRVDS